MAKNTSSGENTRPIAGRISLADYARLRSACDMATWPDAQFVGLAVAWALDYLDGRHDAPRWLKRLELVKLEEERAAKRGK